MINSYVSFRIRNHARKKSVVLNLTCIKTFYHIVSYLLLRSYYIVNSSRAITHFPRIEWKDKKVGPYHLANGTQILCSCEHTLKRSHVDHYHLILDFLSIDRLSLTFKTFSLPKRTHPYYFSPCLHSKRKSSRTKAKSTPKDRYFTQSASN